MADLVGARGAGGESERRRRGYSCVTMSHGTQYWWTVERGAAEQQCGDGLHDGC